MALRDRLKRLTTPVDELDEQRLREWCSSRPGVVPIGEVAARQHATVVGEISSVRIVPHPDGSPWLEASVTDGTGALRVLWTGRTRIAGIRPGQRLVITGRGSLSRDGDRRLTVYNPLYELL